MCTVGFWKDRNGCRHYFKSRDLNKIPSGQHTDFSKNGIFVRDDKKRCEGMNKHGLYIVGLTLKPKIKLATGSWDYGLSEKCLRRCKTAKQALQKFINYNKKHDNVSFKKIIGDANNTYLLEVTIGKFAYADVSKMDFFAATNHGQLIFDSGYYDDRYPAHNESSHVRLETANRMLLETKKYSDLKKILKSTENGDNSICRTTEPITVASYIFTPKTLSGEVCMNSNPIEKRFKKYQL